jgi:hypothetical protein
LGRVSDIGPTLDLAHRHDVDAILIVTYGEADELDQPDGIGDALAGARRDRSEPDVTGSGRGHTRRHVSSPHCRARRQLRHDGSGLVESGPRLRLAYRRIEPSFEDRGFREQKAAIRPIQISRAIVRGRLLILCLAAPDCGAIAFVCLFVARSRHRESAAGSKSNNCQATIRNLVRKNT